jgi:hypothetical protein
MTGPAQPYVVVIEGLAKVRLQVVVREAYDADHAKAEALAYAGVHAAAWRSAAVGWASPAMEQKVVGHYEAGLGEVKRAFADRPT